MWYNLSFKKKLAFKYSNMWSVWHHDIFLFLHTKSDKVPSGEIQVIKIPNFDKILGCHYKMWLIKILTLKLLILTLIWVHMQEYTEHFVHVNALIWKWPVLFSWKFEDTFENIGHDLGMSFKCLFFKMALVPTSFEDICFVFLDLEDIV